MSQTMVLFIMAWSPRLGSQIDGPSREVGRILLGCMYPPASVPIWKLTDTTGYKL
jgi:hypothetical protein